MTYLLTQTLNGLFSAALLFLIASGLTLAFGVMKIVNIAHGSFYMLGVYVAYTVILRTQSLLLGALVAMLAVGAVGFVMQRFFLRRFGNDPLAQMMMTMGFALVFRDAALMIWGGDPFTLPYPAPLRGSMEAGEVVFPLYRLFVIVVAALVGVALWAINEKTLIGARLRATVDDPEMASATGINVARLSGLVFAAGAALAAFGGVMGGPILGGYAGLDFDLLPLAFVVVIIGGMGSLKGALVGSIVVGMIDNFGKALVPELSYFTLFAPMVIVLALKPTGLYRVRESLVAALAVVLVAGPLVFPSYWVGLLTEIIILGMLAMSLDLLLGYTGLPSLGHASLFGVAAYALGVFSTTYQMGFWTSVLGGILVGVLLSAAIGLIVSHVRDVYFLMITLAIGMVLWGLSYRWIPVTGGDNGLSGIPRLELHAGLPFAGPNTFYYIALAVFALSATAIAILVRSPFGLTLRGIRENEGRMKSLGFNTWLHCYLSFILSGFFASIAGIMWAYYNGFVSPTYLDLTASSELFLMVTLGGPATLIGPVLGAGAIVLLKNVMSAYTARWLLILGLVYIAAIIAAPKGVWNLGDRRSG